MIDGLALAITVVVEVGSSVVGNTGLLSEFAVKSLDKEKHPTLRMIGVVFSKTLQNAAAAFALFILGSLAVNPIVNVAAFSFGAVMILTPAMQAAFRNSDHPSLKKALKLMDDITSISAKTINTAILTAGVYLSLGVPAAVVAGLGLGALNVMTFNKA